MRTRTFIALLMAAALLFFYGIRTNSSALAVGAAVPDFSLLTDDGKYVHLADYHDHVVLINFWATTCGACVQEIPSLNRLAQSFTGKPFTILAVSEDDDRDPWNTIAKFRTRVPIEFPVLFDSRGSVANDYGTYMIPESFLLDRAGHLVRKVTGAAEWDHPAMVAEIERLLK